MSPKEESELKTIQKACVATCDVFSKYLKEQIMEVIDADKVFILSFNIMRLIQFSTITVH